WPLQMQCYHCEETLLNNDCSAAMFIVNCTANIQDACQKEVMVGTHGVSYRKACASYTTCLIAAAGYQRFCSPGRVGSVCISCCNTPLCNGPRPPPMNPFFMLFALANSLSMFQAFFQTIYIDDLLIFSQYLPEPIKHVTNIQARLCPRHFYPTVWSSSHYSFIPGVHDYSWPYAPRQDLLRTDFCLSAFFAERINQYGLALALVMKFTVDEINAIPELLPEITVGFENYDCCNQPGVVIQPTLRFLSAAASEDVEVKCNYTEYATRVMAVIGPCSSELATITGKLLGFFLMPQVSYGATSEDLSDKIQYPSFMRTTPSDHWQAKAVVQLLQEFSWNWVAVVGSDDGYGKQGKQQLSSMAADGNICVAYEGLIPVYDNPVPVILDILDHIVEANVGVVVVFATYQVTTAFFREVIRRNLTAVWVATTSWALYSDLNQLPGMGSVGTVLAFSDITQPLSLLSPYVRELFSRMQEERLQQSQRQTDPNISPLDNPCLGCWDLSPENASIVDTVLVQRTAFSVYAAIYTLAYALHHTLGCNETRCSRHPKRDKIYPWQLLEKLQNISLNLNGTKLDFDQMGNPDIGYDILVWVFGNHTITFQNIGNFNQIITINKDLIKWHTANFTVPTSTCSSECQTGQVHIVKGFHSCCFDCIDCQEGTFQNNTDDIQCTVCPDGQWSTLRSTYCVLPTFTYLSWISYEAIGLVLAGVLILCCQAWVGVLFFRHRSTPLVRAAGGKLAGLCLASLMGGCASVVLFLGEPGNVVCSLQQPLNAFFPTVALSAILAVSLQNSLKELLLTWRTCGPQAAGWWCWPAVAFRQDSLAVFFPVDMPRGRSATSVHSDSSEMDFDGIAETEIGKLQRQFRIMEGDRQAYSIQSQEILRKQRLEMEKLRKEQEELQKRLCVSDSDAHRLSDDQNGRRLRSLLTQGNELQEELEQERRSQTELEKEILNVEKKLAELRKGEVSASSTQQSLVRHTRKATCTLENKLDRALVRFNQQLTRNRHLREELETLRVERLRFQQLYHKLDKELQEVRREAGDVISTSTAAYDARLEAQSKMMMMKEKAVKDLAQYSSEVKELERVITHERHLREFMTTKSKERSNRGNTQELIRRQELKAQQRADSGEESMETLEDVFQRIQKVTEEEDLEKLVNRFLQVEDKNFALFNYVNEQNTQAETLRDEISQIKEEMERFRVEGVRQVEEHHMALKQVEEQQREAESHALEYEAQANIIGKVLDQIKTGVNSIFIKINCDHAMVDDWLDSSSRIRDSSIMSYLSLVEQRTSQLLTLQAFLNSKDLEKDYDPKMVAQCLLGQNPELQKETAVIRPAGTGEDNDSEESLFTDEDDRPLTQEELRQRIMNIVLRKEGGFSAERGKEEKFSKLGTLTSQRHHSLEL
ncbi:hypothetical protein P4O66_006087, partial [Electrophorus voltai]